ncbi:MAG: AGE family epimerase/isomerase [Tannerellaceae bacterium]|nr:AGE family epimerase/isomerase [Tannerellaceae bacterium]
MNHLFQYLQSECREELLHGILPYWMGRMVDVEQGGFYGRIDGKDRLHTDADKGGILNARILWTFSSAYLIQPDPTYLQMATRAYEYSVRYFFDKEYGGTFWLLSADGSPVDTKKQIYSQAFFIYALTEYYKASGNEEALDKAKELFQLIEKYSLDTDRNGYLEAYSRDWKLLEDLRLSEKDENDAKTMNTHLHILEAYTNLYRVWKEEALEKALKGLITVFTDKIISSGGHLILFFDENWVPNDHIHSYGHDIEAAWLLYEAAGVLGDTGILEKVRNLTVQIAELTVREGLQADGSLIYEKDTKSRHVDRDRHWWPQAEAVVGFVYTWKLTADPIWLERAVGVWHYIKQHIVDHTHGEWFWSIREGSVNTDDDKAGFWKCPYHNGRMCLEVLHMKE